MKNSVARLLPLRPKPFDDELLSSWVVRVAEANGDEPRLFASLVWPEHIISDTAITFECTLALSESTGVSTKVIEGLAKESYRRCLSANNLHKWVLPMPRDHVPRWKGEGLQYCPGCLQDGTPYVRKHWTLALFAGCVTHACLLQHRCPGCDDGVHPVRHSLLELRNAHRAPVLARCSLCGYDLRWAPPTVISPPLIGFQQLCHSQLERVSVEGVKFFEVLRQVLELLRDERLEPLRRLVRWEAGLPGEAYWDVGKEVYRREFTDLTPAVRAGELEMAAWCMQDWPSNFVKVGEACWLDREERFFKLVRGEIEYMPQDTSELLERLMAFDRLSAKCRVEQNRSDDLLKVS